jgi:hypothetical protein
MSDFQGPDEARLERSRLELSRRAAIATAFGGAITMVGSKSLAARRADPVATTRFGRVSGTVEDGVRVFKGIRYGADTRPRRFLPPLPPESWSGIAPARAYGPASPQRQISEPTSEDCLFLNVWTPALRDGGRRPVMVYLHGGAHSSGSGSDPVYDGVRLCRRCKSNRCQHGKRRASAQRSAQHPGNGARKHDLPDFVDDSAFSGVRLPGHWLSSPGMAKSWNCPLNRGLARRKGNLDTDVNDNVKTTSF